MSLFALLTAAVLVQATPLGGSAAPASSTMAPAPPAVTQPVAVKAETDPMICQSIEVTGTRFTKRQCRRQSEWAQLARDGQDEYEGFFNHGSAWGPVNQGGVNYGGSANYGSPSFTGPR